ncbi:stalk domain-containing protein [Ammoniphilus sp. YIM 78166]|uniref:stalk domain-containing protein n=1 Tax=Ammoniphilus sp. YIM 78166 TaxID=1644106 RepID=UPI0014301539|nr:stalk domain-containing protein [Ammoniphilus sp. YIM 78166]
MKLSKKITLGVIASSLLLGGSALAYSSYTKNIKVTFANIKLIVNGKTIETKAEPFVYNGNVYAPVATIANMLGVSQEWGNNPPSVRFESLDRVGSAPQYMGTFGRQYYPLDYVYALRDDNFMREGSLYNKVVNFTNQKELDIPKNESEGRLYPISGMVHADMFYMLERNSKGTFINGYKIDKVKTAISKVFSREIEPVEGHLTFNEATREFTERIHKAENGKAKLVGVKIYRISWENQITKTDELIME